MGDFGSAVIQCVLRNIAKICDAVLLIEIVEGRDVNYLGNFTAAYCCLEKVPGALDITLESHL